MTERQGDYLWDRSGTPDPQVDELEALLGRLGQKNPPPPFNFNVSAPPRRRPMMGFVALATAAAIVTGMVGLTWWNVQHPAPGFAVLRTAGTPRIGSTDVTHEAELRIGSWLDTPGDARAMIDIGGSGRVDVEPNSRIGAVSTKAGDYRLHLSRGTMHALIWAPPGQFSVDTPSSTAIDLGCAYTLTVGDDGDGLVRVTTGWVGFEWQKRESFIPAGAVCRTRRGLGPGTPHFDDTTERFRAGLDTLDFADASQAALKAAALDAVLADARPRDAMSLWHLLARVDGPARDRVFARLAELVPPPKDVTLDGIRAGRQDMLDLWWNQLGLDTASWWRTWKQQWRDKGDGR
jgi:hypothetical protein